MKEYKHIPKLLIDKPLVFILFSVILGDIIYFSYNRNFIGIVILTIPFILLGAILIDRNFFIVMSLFFIISIISSDLYYNMNENKISNYKVRINKIYSEEIQGTLRGRKVFIIGNIGEAKVGDLIKFNGKFKKNIDIENGIVGEVFIKDNIVIEKDFKSYTSRLSEKYFETIKSFSGKNTSAMLTALVFGNKDYLTYEQKDNMKELGIIHLICISGLHLTLLFSLINKIIGLKLSLIICSIYVLIIGMPVSAVRALIMMIVLGMSNSIHKSYDSISALSLSAIILIFIKPYNLYDIGFNLSYLATLGIILFNSKLKDAFYKFPNSVNSYLSLTLSAQAFIYPYMVLKFNSFSVNFLLAGAIITPIISMILPVAFLTVLFIKTIVLFKVILIPINLLMMGLNGALIVLDYIALPTLYISNSYAICYIIMLISLYMCYKGINEFRKVFYAISIALVISNYSFSTKIKFFQEDWNSAIIIEQGFSKIALTSSDNSYLHNILKKKEGANFIEVLTNSRNYKINNNYTLVIDSKLNNPYLISKEYDIISLKNYKNLYIKIFNNTISKSKY